MLVIDFFSPMFTLNWSPSSDDIEISIFLEKNVGMMLKLSNAPLIKVAQLSLNLQCNFHLK